LDKEYVKTVKDNAFMVIHHDQDFGVIARWVKGLDWGGLLWYWLPLLVYGTAIIYVSSLSVPHKEVAVFLHSVNSLIPADGKMFSVINDKVYHMTEYAILAVLLFRACRYSLKDTSAGSLGFVTVLVVVIFGCTDELHQWYTPLRYTDGWDVLADAMGGLIGVSVWKGALNISVIRLLEERIPLKLQVALGIQVLKI
jgi:VanZ family protein